MRIRTNLLQFLNSTFSLFIQWSATLLIAIALYSIFTQFYTPQRRIIEDEYYPYGWRLLQELQESNRHRLKKAHGYLEAAKVEDHRLSENVPTKLAISIVATNRFKRQYLTQTLGYLLHEIGHTKWPILVCFMEEEKNREMEKLESLGIQITYLYANRTFPWLQPSQIDLRIAKEAVDYWTCMNKSVQTMSANYLLVLEDDALPLKGLAKQLHLLSNKLDKNERLRGVDYVKLFHPWYLRKVPSYFQIIALTFLASFLPILFVQRWRTNSVHYLNSLAITCFLALVLSDHDQQFPSDLRFALTGSPYLTYSESCCTQALLFRATSIPAILNKLSKVESGVHKAKDHLIDQSPFVGRMTDRNLFVHVGHFSTITQRFVEVFL